MMDRNDPRWEPHARMDPILRTVLKNPESAAYAADVDRPELWGEPAEPLADRARAGAARAAPRPKLCRK